MSTVCFSCGREILPVSQSYKADYEGKRVILCYKCHSEIRKHGHVEQFMSTQRRMAAEAGGDPAKLSEEKERLLGNIILTTASVIEGKKVIE